MRKLLKTDSQIQDAASPNARGVSAVASIGGRGGWRVYQRDGGRLCSEKETLPAITLLAVLMSGQNWDFFYLNSEPASGLRPVGPLGGALERTGSARWGSGLGLLRSPWVSSQSKPQELGWTQNLSCCFQRSRGGETALQPLPSLCCFCILCKCRSSMSSQTYAISLGK